MEEVGKGVGAILRADENEVEFLGYGIYVGDEVPPDNVMGFNLGFPNPKIELDSGKIVYGCECWWANEETIKKILDNRKITEIDIDIERLKIDQKTEK